MAAEGPPEFSDAVAAVDPESDVDSESLSSRFPTLDLRSCSVRIHALIASNS